jgi:hypothetical protein
VKTVRKMWFLEQTFRDKLSDLIKDDSTPCAWLVCKLCIKHLTITVNIFFLVQTQYFGFGNHGALRWNLGGPSDIRIFFMNFTQSSRKI